MNDIKYALLNSKIFTGPMTPNFIDSLILFANDHHKYFTFIPSRRQIDYNGGYVGNFTTESFANYVKLKTKYVMIERDHGGPSQGTNYDDGLVSFEKDCENFHCIHIDPWKEFQDIYAGINKTIQLIKYCYELNPYIFYEISTEEAIRPLTCDNIYLLLNTCKTELRPEIFKQILFCVIQSGTSLKDGVNTGNFSLQKQLDMLKVVHSFGLHAKEHNGDFLTIDDIKNRFNNNLDALNIAPEFGIIETKFLLEHMKDKPDLIEEFFNICYKSKKWVKWVSPGFNPFENKLELITICGHYVFNYPEFLSLKSKLSDNIDHLIKQHHYNYLSKYLF